MDKQSILKSFFQFNIVKFGQFTLKSGKTSPIYIDLRVLVSFPKVLQQVANLYIHCLKDLKFDRLVAVPYAALPLVSAISVLGNYPFIYTRKERKEYGTKKLIEGLYKSGERVIIIDDLITTGLSKFEIVEPLRGEGLVVEDVVVLIDRMQGGREALAKKNLKLHSVFDLKEIVLSGLESGFIDKKKYEEVMDYLNND